MRKILSFEMMMRARVAILTMVLVAGGCADDTPDSGGPTIVATTPVLGDIVRTVVGSAASVDVLMPLGADPHSFQPSVREAAELRDADLVVAIGLGLEESLDDVLAGLSDDGVRLLEVGLQADPLPFADAPDTLDPHVWLDPLRGVAMSRAIADELGRLYPAQAATFSSNHADLAARLEAVNRQIEDQLAPVALRTIVTSHDALGYFAARYDLEIIGAITEGGSTAAEPSARRLADLVATIEQLGVKAIFTDSTNPDSLASVVAAEVDGPVAVVELYTGSLGPAGSGAETYVDLLQLNGARVAEGLS